MKIISGAVFRIKTNIGYGFIQNIEMNKHKLYYIRVLDFISTDGSISQTEVSKSEKWCIEFVLNIALSRKIVEKVGDFEIPTKFKIPRFTRTKHIVRNEFLGWHIVDRYTLKRKLKRKLSKKELKLSPSGIMNDTLIVEMLQDNWSLENWK